MNSQDIVGLIAPTMALSLTIAFVAIGSSRKKDRCAATLGFASVLIAAGLFVPWVYGQQFSIAHSLTTDLLCSIAFFPVAKGILLRHDIKPPWMIITMIVCGWLAISFTLSITQYMQNLRIALASFTAAILIIVLLRCLRQVQSENSIDHIIFGVLAVIAIQLIAGPFFTLAGLEPSSILHPDVLHEWSVTVLLMGLSFFTLGLALLAACIVDLISDIRIVAQTDALSGLMNRLGFEDEAKIAVKSAIICNQPLSFIICDIDHFKKLNDKYGHEVGDLVIKSTGELLGAMKGHGYLIARLGGDEFGILMPNANLQMARLYAEAIRTSTKQAHLPMALENHELTMSFGVACLGCDEDYLSLFSRAHAALNDAKNNARNRVMIDGQVPLIGSIDRVMSA